MSLTHQTQCLGQSLAEIIKSVEILTHRMLPIINFINLHFQRFIMQILRLVQIKSEWKCVRLQAPEETSEQRVKRMSFFDNKGHVSRTLLLCCICLDLPADDHAL